jgi:uncharacterized membrane protein YebE (DUF533 family)
VNQPWRASRFSRQPAAATSVELREGGENPMYLLRKSSSFSSSLLALVFLAAAGTAVAQSSQTPNLDKREARQQRRIAQGVQSGQLTPAETANLDAREAKLNADEAKAKSDGVVTNKERARLQAEANRDSKAIYRKKHNARVAPN